MALILTTEQELAIRRHAELQYPGECCGALIGTTVDEANYVSQAVPLNNSHEDGPDRRFRIAPADFLACDRLARKLGKSIVGFYHSHPDVPPVPSSYDLDHAWEGYSYVIVEARSGVPKSMRSWTVSPRTSKFVEEKFVVSDCVLHTSAKKAASDLEPG